MGHGAAVVRTVSSCQHAGALALRPRLDGRRGHHERLLQQVGGGLQDIGDDVNTACVEDQPEHGHRGHGGGGAEVGAQRQHLRQRARVSGARGRGRPQHHGHRGSCGGGGAVLRLGQAPAGAAARLLLLEQHRGLGLPSELVLRGRVAMFQTSRGGELK